MENTFTSNVRIEDDSDLDEAKGLVCAGVDALARSHGFVPTREQVVLGTTFGIVEKEDGTRLLQGTFTAS